MAQNRTEIIGVFADFVPLRAAVKSLENEIIIPRSGVQVPPPLPLLPNGAIAAFR